MAFFDATLFTVIPRLYRALDAALDPPDAVGRRVPPPTPAGRGRAPPRVGPFLRPGSWIGGDRDGNPGVTAEITERTLRIQADHVLRGYEAVATRLMQTIAAATTGEPGGAAARLAPGTRRRGPARDRSPAPPPLPGRAVPPALRVHRRAAAPDTVGPGRRGGAADRALRVRRRAGRGAGRDSRRARRRRSRPRRRGARSRNCAGRSGRSGSTSPRSRSASTPRSMRRRWRRSVPGRPGDRGRAGRHARRGPRHVPGDRRGPGTVRHRGLPSLRRQLHRLGVGRDRRARARPHGRGHRRADGSDPPPSSTSSPCSNRASALEQCRRDPRRAARRPGLPCRPRGARRSPGGDARLLGLEQGIGLPVGGLDAPPGAVRAGRGGPGARRRADALPRPRRCARARRRTDEPGDPRPGAGLGRRPAQADRAGRGHRRQLRRPDHRPAPPRADDRRDPARPPHPSTTRASKRALAIGAPIVDELRRGRGRPTGRSSTTTRASLRSSATSRRSASCPISASGRGRPRAGGATKRRRSTRCAPSRGPSPGRSRASTCPGWYGLGMRWRHTAPRTARTGWTPSRGSRATGRSCRASSTTPR